MSKIPLNEKSPKKTDRPRRSSADTAEFAIMRVPITVQVPITVCAQIAHMDVFTHARFCVHRPPYTAKKMNTYEYESATKKLLFSLL